MKGFLKFCAFLAVAAYIVSPVDLVPGPIDDAILLMMSIGAAGGGKALKG